MTVALLVPSTAFAAGGFDVIVLGALGGLHDGDLSGYLVRPHGDRRAVTCDAGSLIGGLEVAEARGSLDDVRVPDGSRSTPAGHVFRDEIAGHLVSHAHLDHLAGLVVASPADRPKPIYALASVQSRLVDHYFNGQVWPNFTDRGSPPRLGTYALVDLTPRRPRPLRDTAMRVTAFPLRHAGVESTAFLIEHDDDALLCFGDTGPDAIEGGSSLADVWTAVAPLLRDGRLKGIVIETSYDDARPDRSLYGHLTPRWLLASLRDLDALAGGRALAGLPVLVGHMKPTLETGEPAETTVRRQLDAGNDLGVRFVIARQGDLLRFP